MSNPPSTPSANYEMVSVEEAQRRVLDQVTVLPSVEIPTEGALGYITAAEVKAKDPLPPFPASIKDGYAVVHKTAPGEFPIETAIHAGSGDRQELKPGTVCYIATGAPVPMGADAVVEIEKTTFLGKRDGKDYVKIEVAPSEGQDIRPIGSDISVADQIVAKGDSIGAAEIGLLATIGCQTIQAVRKPKVAVMSTGDELIDFRSADQLSFGQIRDANRPMILAACRQLGLETVDLSIVKDTEADMRSAVQSALDQAADVIICSGGVSMGSKDAVKPVIESMGNVHFGKVKMKPGKPLTFATLDRVLFFGLPGNPVSSYACFHLFVIPALNKLQGVDSPLPRRIEVSLSHPAKLDPVRPEYARAIAYWKE